MQYFDLIARILDACYWRQQEKGNKLSIANFFFFATGRNACESIVW